MDAAKRQINTKLTALRRELAIRQADEKQTKAVWETAKSHEISVVKAVKAKTRKTLRDFQQATADRLRVSDDINALEKALKVLL